MPCLLIPLLLLVFFLFMVRAMQLLLLNSQGPLDSLSSPVPPGKCMLEGYPCKLLAFLSTLPTPVPLSCLTACNNGDSQSTRLMKAGVHIGCPSIYEQTADHYQASALLDQVLLSIGHSNEPSS